MKRLLTNLRNALHRRPGLPMPGVLRGMALRGIVLSGIALRGVRVRNYALSCTNQDFMLQGWSTQDLIHQDLATIQFVVIQRLAAILGKSIDPNYTLPSGRCRANSPHLT